MGSYVWNPLGQDLDVLTHTRDLGTHLFLNVALIGSSVNDRIKESTKTIDKISRLPFTTNVKATLIRVSVFAKALYGIEAAPCTASCVVKLRTLVVNAVGPHSSMRSPGLVFMAAADGDDLDPVAQVASLRPTTMRRLLAWYPSLKPEAEQLLEFYLEQNMVDGGKNKPEDDDQENQDLGEEEHFREHRKTSVFKALSAFLFPQWQ